MIGHLQQSLGIRLQWEKSGSGAANGALALGDGPKDQPAQPLGGAAERRRLRHVSQLAVRGLDVGAAGFVLELAAEGGEALERSEAFRTRNPSWEPPCGVRRGRQLSAFELRARAPDSAEGTAGDEVLWRKVVDLTDLDPLYCEELSELQAPPPLGVPLVQLGKEWFAYPTPATASAAPAPQADRSRQRAGPVKKISTTEICSAGDHITAMIARLADLRVRSEALRSAMDEPLQLSRTTSARREQRLQSRQRVEELRQQVGERDAGLQRLRSRLEAARARRPSGGSSSSGALLAAATGPGVAGDQAAEEQAAAEDRAGVLAANRALHGLWMQLRCRQMRMMHEACTVYPIEKQSNGKVWAIRGQALAGIEALKRMDLREEENVSTALGFLTHLVVTLASILEVPLRFAVRDAGSSRSCVRDLHESIDACAGPAGTGGGPGSARGGAGARAVAPAREWPLYYTRDLKKLQFETALRLVQDALLQFAYSRGQVGGWQCSNNLLECVQQILRREFFGPEAAG